MERRQSSITAPAAKCHKAPNSRIFYGTFEYLEVFPAKITHFGLNFLATPLFSAKFYL